MRPRRWSAVVLPSDWRQPLRERPSALRTQARRPPTEQRQPPTQRKRALSMMPALFLPRAYLTRPPMKRWRPLGWHEKDVGVCVDRDDLELVLRRCLPRRRDVVMLHG